MIFSPTLFRTPRVLGARCRRVVGISRLQDAVDAHPTTTCDPSPPADALACIRAGDADRSSAAAQALASLRPGRTAAYPALRAVGNGDLLIRLLRH